MLAYFHSQPKANFNQLFFLVSLGFLQITHNKEKIKYNALIYNMKREISLNFSHQTISALKCGGNLPNKFSNATERE